MSEFNKTSLTALCADICSCMNVEPPKEAEPSLGKLKELCGGKVCDRIVMYNPDAQAQWLVEKYPEIFRPVTERASLAYPMAAVMPSVTPVCFATMYTGAYPEKHGIQKYEKPVLKIDTIFDAMIRAGKKCAIVAMERCSIAEIFLEREEVDYYILPSAKDCNEKVVLKGLELIREDKYDFLVIYNGAYDSMMHATYPEAPEAMEWLVHHAGAYARIYDTVKEAYKGHTTLVGYATDHGVHTNEAGRGTHGANIPEDINITHFYDVI
ncbi:MAG: hypothetical protein E7632_01605 [Ruminococcaceae bacterium]|nr:hypothetical protein [Oscillospiraceae bacterium]